MFEAPVRFAQVARNATVGTLVVVAAFAAASFEKASAQPVLTVALVGPTALDAIRQPAFETLAEAGPELSRHRARGHGAKVYVKRMTPAERARAVRIARIMRIYRAMRIARARIPVAKRVARASAELARAQRRGDQFCLATAIYHESRLEPVRGQRAVAEVILARTRVPGRPRSICGVVYEGAWRATGCQFSFTCDGLTDRPKYPGDWEEANRVAADALAARGGKRYARGATFYHASYVRPRWSKRMVRVARIGAHIFYRPRRGRLL